MLALGAARGRISLYLKVFSCTRILPVAAICQPKFFSTEARTHLQTVNLTAAMSSITPTDPPTGCYESLLKSVELCRLMLPDDANVSGNVHGGTILKMIEEAGMIITTRYVNSEESRKQSGYEPAITGLVRVEKTDFRLPMFIGEVAELVAEITYTSPHSLEVHVCVWAENVIKGGKRLTNKATLWYVPLNMTPPFHCANVMPMRYRSSEDEESGRERYLRQKEQRQNKVFSKTPKLQRSSSILLNSDMQYTVEMSQSSLIHMVGVQDCTQWGYCRAGVVMKLMDQCAGIVAAKHCRTNVVTASIDTTDFHDPVKKGDLITMTGYMIFTSFKSMEIEVLVDVERLVDGKPHRTRAVTSYFTFVSLDKEKKVQEIPPLKIMTEDESKRFEEGRQRYDQRKRSRLLSSETLPRQQAES